MPFCRECGKGVEEDWVTCPFCSQLIGPPAARVAEISDSVVMGDVNIDINESEECPSCYSVGAPIIACKECSELCACTLCINDSYPESLRAHLFYKFESSKFSELVIEKLCFNCAIKFADSICNMICIHCNRRYEFPDNELREDLGEEVVNQWCVQCNTLEWCINSCERSINEYTELLSDTSLDPEIKSFYEEELKGELEMMKLHHQMWDDFGSGRYYSN